MSPVRQAMRHERTNGASTGVDAGPTSFSLGDGRTVARTWLREVLHYQIASETAHWLYERVAFMLIAASCVLWLAAAWPTLLAQAVVRTMLVVWVLLLAAVLGARWLENRWLRRQSDILHRTREENSSR
jgi:hypothetical protein